MSTISSNLPASLLGGYLSVPDIADMSIIRQLSTYA
jgi:hypothetical protein